jgi:hypothetical protein
MADHIDGPLYYERMGRTGPVRPSCASTRWDRYRIFQMATCPLGSAASHRHSGYGRSPKARDGLTMSDMAEGC